MADLASTAADAVAVADPPVVETGPDREFDLIPLERILIHPLNLRRELRGIDELADSIRQNGLLEPVLLVPTAERGEDGSVRYVLVAGHRRHAACMAVKHSPVEAIIRRDMDSEGAQVIAMLTENGPRDDLTPIEEARGYQLALDLNSLTPSKLAKKLGKPRAIIASRVALTKLPEQVQEQIHSRQITLQEADALVEFAGDRSVFDDLLRDVGTANFPFHVERERRRREQRAKVAELRRQLAETGVRIIDRPWGFDWRSVEKHVSSFVDPDAAALDDGSPGRFTPATHATACSHHAVFVDPNDIMAVYVCTNPDEAGHTTAARVFSPSVHPSTAGGPMPVAEPTEAERMGAEEVRLAEEQRREDAAREEAERREALEVAGRVRRTFLATTIQRSGKAHLIAILRLVLTEHFQAWLDDASLEDVDELASLIDAKLTPRSNEKETFDDRMEVVEDNLRAALDSRRTADALAGALLAILAQDREFALRQGFGWGDERCRRYVDFLVEQGYELSEIERDLIERYDADRSDSPAVATA